LWHDGVPLTMADVVFAFEVLAHPDYRGVRRNAEMRLITGFDDMVNGLADHISGLVLSNNDRTLTIHMDDMPIGVLYFAMSLTPMPRHVFEGIPVADMPTSPPVMDANYIIGWGPFRIVSITPGDAVIMERFDDFVFGRPYIEHVRVERFNDDHAGELMEAGHFDMISTFPTALFQYHQDPTNFRFLSSPSPSYGYVAFRMGTFHWDEWEARMDDDRLMVRLGADFRRAMGYAVNPGLFGEIFQSGLNFPAQGMVPPNHPALINPDVPRITYNVERANELLDNAGFTERDEDGMRMFNGERLTLQWALASGTLDEERFQFYSQAWANVGIRVELWGGRIHDVNYLWDVLDESLYRGPDYEHEIHIWQASWQTGFNPNQNEAWGHMFWNASLYMTPEYLAILDRMAGEEAWDNMFGIFTDWQQYFYDNVPAFPLNWGIALTAVNNRVANWDTRIENSPSQFHSHFGWQDIRLTASDANRPRR
jgi:peptide/nickel transport system substrate-binding protein